MQQTEHPDDCPMAYSLLAGTVEAAGETARAEALVLTVLGLTLLVAGLAETANVSSAVASP